MWNCVQIEEFDDRFGKLRRKILFEEISNDKRRVVKQSQDSGKKTRKNGFYLEDQEAGDYQYGTRVYYYDNCEADVSKRIKEARFVGSSNTMDLTPKQIVTQLLNTEYELIQFCQDYKLPDADSIIEHAVDAYDYIRERINDLTLAREEVQQQLQQAHQQHIAQHTQIQIQPTQVQQQSPTQAIIQSQPQQQGLIQTSGQQLIWHNSRLYAIVPQAGSNISHGIPVQLAKQEKPAQQTETRAFRNGVQNVQQTDGQSSYEIIQQSDADENDEQSHGQIEEQYESTTWSQDDQLQAQNLEVTREETIEANCELDPAQTSGQQTTTITTVNPNNPQAINYSNQITPTTQVLLTTNHLGQTQVIPVSIDTGMTWGGQNIQQVIYPMTTVINQQESSQVTKVTQATPSVQMQTQLAVIEDSTVSDGRIIKSFEQRTERKRNTPCVKKFGSPNPSGVRKKRTWKSLVLPPEIIPISPHGTWEKPVLERIAPGQNYKDMRTWVFYLSVYGKLFKAVVEKILHEKSTAYLTCSNAKKKALMDKCKWRGRLFMQDPLVDPDTDEFANLSNWSVVPVKNYHQHRHENCYVEGIKHYNTQNAKRCRAERGQVIAVCDGVVKDLSNLPSHEQQRVLALAGATESEQRIRSINEVRNERELQKGDGSFQLMLEDVDDDPDTPTIIQQNENGIPMEEESLPLETSQIEHMNGQMESSMEEVVEEGIVEQSAVQSETVQSQDFEIPVEGDSTLINMKTEHEEDEEQVIDEEIPISEIDDDEVEDNKTHV